MAHEDTMRALALEGFDSPAAVIEVPVPEPGTGEVLVRVLAASVNAYDVVVAMGMMKDYLPYGFPAVIGMDVAGVVERVGEGVDAPAVGDRVFGRMGNKPAIHDGSFGERATPQAAALAITPGNVNDEQAGSLGVAGTTAKSAIDAVELGQGAMVLVVGATGGVGTFAVQLAAMEGAHVLASGRPGDEALLTELGAAEVVDYTRDLGAEIRGRYPNGVDAVLDFVNRDPGAFGTLAGLARPGGRAISAVGGAGEATELDGVTVANVGSDAAHLAPLAALVAEGKLRAAIQQTYPLAAAAEALQDFTAQHTLGKRVITMP